MNYSHKQRSITMENILASFQGTLKVEVLSAVVPLLMFLSMGLIGLVLAHPKYQLVPRATFTFLSKLVFVVFLPCLIFTYLGPTITLKNLLLWWFIPVNVVLSTAIGCVLGLLVALICRPPRDYFRFTIIMTAFGNTGNLPLAIVTSICQSDDNPFGSDCYDYGVSYVSFSQWVSVILVYTLVYHMMEPPLRDQSLLVEEEEDDEDEIFEEIMSGPNYEDENHLSRPLLVEAEWPGIEDKETEHCKTPFIARLFTTRSSSARLSVSTIPDVIGSTEEEGTSNYSSKCLAEPRVVRKFRSVVGMTPIHYILQPPTIASLLAIIIGMVPTLKSIVYDDDAVLSFITDSLEILSEAMVPSAMLVLGGSLAQGPNESNLGVRTTVGIIIARLFILPLIGIGVIHLADKWNILVAGDQMFRLVLLLQYTMPSAILLGAIASLRGYAVKEASALLFWQHVVAVLSISFYIIVYFYILF
ncbi:putative membrane transport protein [Rosa chinensis]|uniref:Putative membrane transport protein n=1 Tax=Rosa chinensis TaxID=74649 RepID=A0A2P6RGT1_ROSCH|nr:protein PIN-LIKES 2 [Rosa chinensis]PRQ45634.1 putative membrane transport protein [Rosa chinensis]